MNKPGLLAAAAALALLAQPVMAAGTSTQQSGSVGTPTGTSSATMHHTKSPKSGGSSHAMRTAHASKASPNDAMADQLNGQSLQAAQQGKTYTPGQQ